MTFIILKVHLLKKSAPAQKCTCSKSAPAQKCAPAKKVHLLKMYLLKSAPTQKCTCSKNARHQVPQKIVHLLIKFCFPVDIYRKWTGSGPEVTGSGPEVTGKRHRMSHSCILSINEAKTAQSGPEVNRKLSNLLLHTFSA